jgi:hypothetical protein
VLQTEVGSGCGGIDWPDSRMRAGRTISLAFGRFKESPLGPISSSLSRDALDSVGRAALPGSQLCYHKKIFAVHKHHKVFSKSSLDTVEVSVTQGAWVSPTGTSVSLVGCPRSKILAYGNGVLTLTCGCYDWVRSLTRRRHPEPLYIHYPMSLIAELVQVA